jgi:phosphomannomutase
MPAHFFFDLDNTLTRSKSHIAPEHKPILRKLVALADVIVVSGHAEKDIKAHLEDVAGFYTMGQNGNVAKRPDGSVLWERKLSEGQKKAIYAFTDKARKHLAYTVRDENDIVEDRGAQIAFSLIGHHENQDVKDAFDPAHEKRKKLLEDLRADVENLREKHNVDVLIAGTTNLDIIERGKNKGFNITEFISLMGWKKEECLYIGDALFPGGNDETVIGVIPTKPVKGYAETYAYLESILAKP